MRSQVEETIAEIPEEDFLRAQFYAFLAQLLSKSPNTELLETIAKSEGDDSPMGLALLGLAQAAGSIHQEAVDEEYTKLFFGMGQGGEILPYGSYYLTGLLYDQALSKLRQDMQQLGIERGNQNKEPEDHIAYLMEIMHGLIIGRFDEVKSLSDQRAFFDAHISPWAIKLFTDLEAAESSTFYKAVFLTISLH